MAKAKSQYVCGECGGESPRWTGQCAACGKWDTMQEFHLPAAARSKSGAASAHWAGAAGGKARDLSSVEGGPDAPRLRTGIGEFDRALGGGVVQGSVVLLGGDPGIGKSTLLLQALAAFSGLNARTLYVSGEESLAQVASRAGRLGLSTDKLRAQAETDVDAVLATLADEKPQVAVIDSIQTMRSEALESAAGTVSQVRECAGLITRYAKQHNCAVFLVGHVTKDGTLAGPRVLEHLVDAVLYFEGDPQSPYRMVRALKNRFGAVNELGAFEMTEQGLVSVDNPSAMFLAADRQKRTGSCVFVLQEGPRPLLIEIQALLDETTANNPRRLAVGVDANRLSMLLAVLHKHGQFDIGGYDVFANAVGGVKAQEPAADLPMLLAMLSSLTEKSLPTDFACFGEAGLTGEIRPVQNAADRLREAAKLGFKRLMVPARNVPSTIPNGVEVVGVSTLAEAIAQMQRWA